MADNFGQRKADFGRAVRRIALLALALGVGSLTRAQSALWEGSVEAGRAKSVTCAACHGVDGNSVTPDWPVLAGQHARYIAEQLRSYQNGERQEVSMNGFAAMLSDQDILDVAAYFASQTPAPDRGADPELVSQGERIYRGGIVDRGVAACIACHGPNGKGNPLAAYPVIRGQHETYVFNTLRAYASGARRSDIDMNQMMRNVAALLREDEMRALASYIQGLR